MADVYGHGYYGGYAPVVTVVPPPAEVTAPSTPDLRVLIDFVNDLNPVTPQEFSAVSAAPVWTDVSDRLRGGSGLSLARGRQRPLDRNEAGTATLVLDNYDRAFDPESSNSFGVTPLMRHVRTEAGFARTTSAFKVGSSKVGSTDLVGGGPSTIWEPLFDGYIESWSFDYPERGFDATATARCMDLLGVMAKDTLSGTIPIQNVYHETALNLVLNYRPYTGRAGPDPVLGYPYGTIQAGDRDIESISVTSAGNRKFAIYLGAYTGVPLRTPIDDITRAEGGNFFIDRGGRCAYRDHDWPLQPAGPIRVAVDAERFSDTARVMDETLIYNYVYLVGGDEASYAVREDKGSQARYLRRPFPTQNIGLYQPLDLEDRAEQILLRYREPQIYLAKLDMSNAITDWQQMLTADLWDIVTVDVPLPNGDVISQRSMIEGIEISTSSRQFWNVVWWLSLPVFPNLFLPDAYSFEGFDVFGEAHGSVGGWTAETNCTVLAQDTQVERIRHGGGRQQTPITYTFESKPVYASRGAWVLQAEATSTGNVSCLSPAAAVEGRQIYVGKAQLRLVNFGLAGGEPSETNPATDTTRQATLELDWYDSAMTLLSTSSGVATTVNAVPITAWFEARVDVRAPDAARFAQMRVKTVGTGKAGFYVDEASLKRGG
jgi:hypothetical protein